MFSPGLICGGILPDSSGQSHVSSQRSGMFTRIVATIPVPKS